MADRARREIGGLSVLEKEKISPVFCKRGILDFLFLRLRRACLRWPKTFMIILVATIVSYLPLSVIILILARRGKEPQLILANTTSVQDSGLWMPCFPRLRKRINSESRLLVWEAGRRFA
jgi:hypothetical protein